MQATTTTTEQPVDKVFEEDEPVENDGPFPGRVDSQVKTSRTGSATNT